MLQTHNSQLKPTTHFFSLPPETPAHEFCSIRKTWKSITDQDRTMADASYMKDDELEFINVSDGDRMGDSHNEPNNYYNNATPSVFRQSKASGNSVCLIRRVTIVHRNVLLLISASDCCILPCGVQGKILLDYIWTFC